MSDFVKVYLELLSLLPFPLRVSVFTLVTSFVLFWFLKITAYVLPFLGKAGVRLVDGLVRILLLPEKLLKNFLGLFGVKYVPGMGFYDEVIVFLGKLLYRFFELLVKIKNPEMAYPFKAMLLISIIVFVSWYVTSWQALKGTVTQDYVIRLFTLYANMEISAGIEDEYKIPGNASILDDMGLQKPEQPNSSPTVTAATSLPQCLTSVVVDDTDKGDILHIACGDWHYQTSPLAKGKFLIDVDKQIVVYCSNQGDVYVVRVKEEKLRSLGSVKTQMPYNRKSDIDPILSFYQSDDYYLVIKDGYTGQSAHIKIPRDMYR